MPRHKHMKDRITILVYTNTSGDCKIKPRLEVKSEDAHELLKATNFN